MRSLRVIPSRYFQPQHPKMNDLYIKVNTFIFFTCNIIIKHIPIIKYIIVKEMYFDKKSQSSSVFSNVTHIEKYAWISSR